MTIKEAAALIEPPGSECVKSHLQLRDDVEKKLRFINQNKEKLLEAWLAETGFLPSESILCIDQSDFSKIRIWVERKDKINEY